MSPVTRIDRRVFDTAISTKRKLGQQLHNNDRLHNLIESYDNVLDYQDVTQHELMLADRPRVDCYYQGIKDHVGPETTLINLGTGTLSMFAARIYALDHCDIIDTAEELAKANGLADRIEFVRRKSTEFESNVLSNSPAHAPTSWQTPLLSIESRDVAVGDVVTIELTVPDFANPDKWTWQVEVNGRG